MYTVQLEVGVEKNIAFDVKYLHFGRHEERYFADSNMVQFNDD